MAEHKPQFDFALSFAGAQRSLAEDIRNRLLERKYSVFYDRDYEHEMIGRNGAEYLRNIYSRQSKYCIVLISKEYDKSQWASLEKEAIEGRELRGEQGVLIPVKTSEHSPEWLPETRIYFDLNSRSLEEFTSILEKIVGNSSLRLNDVKTQEDLHRALPGTTWRKKSTELEQLIFRSGGLFYNNHAGHPSWRENYYQIGEEFRRFSVTWTADYFTTECEFNEDFSEFKELKNPKDGTWSLLSVRPHTPYWGV